MRKSIQPWKYLFNKSREVSWVTKKKSGVKKIDGSGNSFFS